MPMTRKEVAEVIVDHILREGLSNGDQIMSIPKLARTLGTSDKTVQKAIAGLKEDDVLFSINGKGNFVKRVEIVDKSSCLRVAVFDDESDKLLEYFTGASLPCNGALRIIHKKFPPDSSIKDIINVYKADVILFDESNIRHLRRSDILEPLSMNDIPELASPRLLDPCLSNNELHAVPLFFSPIVTIINCDMFESLDVPIPESWNLTNFMKTAKALSMRKKRRIIGVGVTVSPYRLPAVFASFGAFPIKSDSFSRIERTLAFIKKIISFNKANHAPLLKYQYFRLFEDGHMGMTFTSYNALRNVSNIEFEWDLLPMPKTSDGGTCFVCAYGAIPKISRKKYYARKFLDELTSYPAQKFLKERCFLLPVNRDVAEDETIAPPGAPKRYHSYLRELDAMSPISDFFLSKELQAEFEYQLTLFISGIKSLKDTAEAVYDIFNHRKRPGNVAWESIAK